MLGNRTQHGANFENIYGFWLLAVCTTLAVIGHIDTTNTSPTHMRASNLVFTVCVDASPAGIKVPLP